MTLEVTDEVIRVHDCGVTKATLGIVRIDGHLALHDLQGSGDMEAIVLLKRAVEELMKTERIWTRVDCDEPRYEHLIEFYKGIGLYPVTTYLASNHEQHY